MSLPPPLSSPQCRPVFFDDDASQNQVQNFQSAVVHVFLEVRHFDGAASNDDSKRAVQDMQGTVGTNASPPWPSVCTDRKKPPLRTAIF